MTIASRTIEPRLVSVSSRGQWDRQTMHGNEESCSGKKGFPILSPHNAVDYTRIPASELTSRFRKTKS